MIAPLMMLMTLVSPAHAVYPEDASASQACNADALASTTQVVVEDSSVARNLIDIASTVPVHVTSRDGLLLRGPCVKHIDAARFGIFRLNNGEFVRLSIKGGLEPLRQDASEFLTIGRDPDRNRRPTIRLGGKPFNLTAVADIAVQGRTGQIGLVFAADHKHGTALVLKMNGQQDWNLIGRSKIAFDPGIWTFGELHTTCETVTLLARGRSQLEKRVTNISLCAKS